jgi:hypothetical protein
MRQSREVPAVLLAAEGKSFNHEGHEVTGRKALESQRQFAFLSQNFQINLQSAVGHRALVGGFRDLSFACIVASVWGGPGSKCCALRHH